MSTPLELGNRAWSPYKTVDSLEVLDRHNGIPTLGFFTAGGQRQLFWQALGYVTDDFSVWIYAPVSPAAPADPRLPEGLILDSPTDRIVTVGVAHHNRLIFEREWNVPAGADGGRLLHDVTHFPGGGHGRGRPSWPAARTQRTAGSSDPGGQGTRAGLFLTLAREARSPAGRAWAYLAPDQFGGPARAV